MTPTTQPTDINTAIERKLKIRSRFWHLVKDIRELQILVYQEKRSTKEQYHRLNELLRTLDSYLGKVAEKLLSLGILKEEKEDTVKFWFGDATDKVPRPVYTTDDNFGKEMATVFSVYVICMRQLQRQYLATRKTFLYPRIFDAQGLVDEYLAKGELHDQLALMPKKK